MSDNRPQRLVAAIDDILKCKLSDRERWNKLDGEIGLLAEQLSLSIPAPAELRGRNIPQWVGSTRYGWNGQFAVYTTPWEEWRSRMQILRSKAEAATETTQPPKGKAKGNRKSSSTIERDKGWLEEFERLGYTNITAFAQYKHEGRATMSTALKRARAAREKPRRKGSKRT